MDELSEQPFLIATSLDGTLGRRPGLQKSRKFLGELLGPAHKVSLGRSGTCHLTSVATLVCLVAERRWDREQSERLAGAYRNAGLQTLVRSKEYRALAQRTGEAVSRALLAAPERTARSVLLSQSVAAIVLADGATRTLVDQMRAVHAAVDAELDEVVRLPGRLVRMEGTWQILDEDRVRFESPDPVEAEERRSELEAVAGHPLEMRLHEGRGLLVVDTGEREELRLVDAAYLESTGISEPGDTFVLHRLQFSPDSRTELFVPAVSTRVADPAEVAELDAAEVPLLLR